jgi:tRNA (guanine-N7-)-methyltransferase
MADADRIPPLRFQLGDPRWLLELRYLPWPVEWAACFGRSGPLHVELGFGDGAFLAALARRMPAANLIGVERALEPTRWALQRLRREGAENVRPKARHHHRRLLTPSFLHLAAHRLRPGGLLTIATDDPDYALWIAEALRGAPGLESVFETPCVHALPGREPTRYERKALAAGRTCSYFVWQRAGPVPAPALPRIVQREALMPHRIWEGDLDLSRVAAQLRGRLWQDGETIWRVTGLYQALEGEGLLIELLMAEGAWVETVALIFRPHGPGLWILKPTEIGGLRPNMALKMGVQRLAQAVEQATPGLRVVSSTI